MSAIHHASFARAKKLGVELAIDGDAVRGFDPQGNRDTYFYDTSGKKVLERILEARSARAAAAAGQTPHDGAAPATEEAAPATTMAGAEVAAPKTPSSKRERAPQATRAPKQPGAPELTKTGAVSRSVVSAKYRERYAATAGNCGDALAAALRAACNDDKGRLSLEQLAAVAVENGLDLAQWHHLDAGRKRMTIGNVLRGRWRRGQPVQIAGATIAGG
jgi:hypothetical protein